MSDPISAPSDESISFRPFFEALWAERYRFLRLWAIVALVLAVGAPTYYLTRPIQRVAGVEFRLLFEGADSNKYPNGTPFSRSDLIAGPVVTKVYEDNDLEQHLSFESFKSSLFVFESSRDVEMLNFEYQAKLSESRLDSVQRAELESEYRQKLAALSVPQFSLQFSKSGRAASPPTAVMQKVLNDILATWAEQTAVQRGALGYQIELLTPNVILTDTLSTQTILIRYDMLRRHVGRVRAQVDRLTELPGAHTTRVGSGRMSLMDLRTSLEDILQFQLNTLIKRRLIYALPPNEVALNSLYLEDRLVELRQFRQTATLKKVQLEAALQSFTSDVVAANAQGGPGASGGQPSGVVPQLSDSFLDRLMDIAGKSSAMEFRTDLTNRIIETGEEGLSVEEDIAFYEETLRLLRTAAQTRPAVLRPEDVAKAFDEIQARVIEILTLTNEAYATVSAANLNPRTLLYTLTGPYTAQTIRPVSLRYLAMVAAVFLVVAGILIALGVAGLALFKQSSFAQKKGYA